MDNRGAGRFAPSPSGRMHLGNVYTALIAWLDAAYRGQRRVLRIEDLDPQRSRLEYAQLIEDDLHWLGLDFEEGGLRDRGDYGPYSQSKRHHLYREALEKLALTGMVYPCTCTRADLKMTQAPHASDGRILYPGTCRPPYLKSTSENITPTIFTEDCPDKRNLASTIIDGADISSLRLYIPDKVVQFKDEIFGNQSVNIAAEFGDLMLRRADGAWAYQLAVVIDDALMGITTVVRGADLLYSAAPQIYLHTLLGYTPPRFLHVPLICNADGKRLSKRDGDLNMETLRKRYPSDAIIGYLAHLAGLIPNPSPITPELLIPQYSPEKIPRVPTLIIKPHL